MFFVHQDIESLRRGIVIICAINVYNYIMYTIIYLYYVYNICVCIYM